MKQQYYCNPLDEEKYESPDTFLPKEKKYDEWINPEDKDKYESTQKNG